MTSQLEWVLNRMSRRGPSPEHVRITTTGHSAADIEEARRFDALKRRRGERAALDIAELHDRFEASRRWRVPDAVAWEWAEAKYDEGQLAAEAGTGYDPDEEYRPL